VHAGASVSALQMKSVRSIVVATAGHIDHGKTSLVRALTGIDTDRLPEEKRRGITIDLGFASFEMDASQGSSLRVSFVDVPGHALFIRNMLAGTGCVPAVMLVIAADEGVMPQTREHLAICELLGITDGFTVISKADLVSDSQLEQVREQIYDLLENSFLNADKPVIPSSTRDGRGFDEIRAELARIATHGRGANRTRPMRLPIDRVFVKKGFGTVVTGTLLSGEVRLGENLMLQPGDRGVRVRGLQTHGASEEVVRAGSRLAVNLSGVDVGEISRGQVLVADGGLTATDVIDTEITLLEDAPPLKHGARVHLHAFTSEVMARVFIFVREPIQPGRTGLARLQLAHPIVLLPGDRFVIRHPLPAGTVGGGRVLDARPLVHERRAVTHKWLEGLTKASPVQQLESRVKRRNTDGIQIQALAREMGLSVEGVSELATDLRGSGELIVVSSEVMIARDAFCRAVDDVSERLKSGEVRGVKRSLLQSQSGLSDEVFSSVLEALVADGKAQLSGEVITIPGAEPSIFDKDVQKLRLISAAYHKAGLAAPGVKELAEQLGLEEAEIRRLLTLLMREKTLLRMGSDDLFVHADALRELAGRMAQMSGKVMDVAAFKSMTGLTRKHAIPLLELLDRERITRRQGELRFVV
jgi:selenocysteine-specific elongation factor